MPEQTSISRSPGYDKARARILHPVLRRLFFLGKLPMALIAGLRVEELDYQRCETSVPYRWLTTNPFKSTYFAPLAMAAELCTGALVLLAIRSSGKSVASLIVSMKGEFRQKATGRTRFICRQGPEVFNAVERTAQTGQPVTIELQAMGESEDGQNVAVFTFEWSVKLRSRQ